MFIKNCSDILLFDNILSFSSNIKFSCAILFLFEKYCLHAFQNGSKLKSTLRFSNYYNLAYLFRFVNRFCCHLNFTLSLGYFDLFALLLRHDIIIICFRRFLIKWAFWFLHRFFVFLGACLHKIETKLLLKAAWVLIGKFEALQKPSIDDDTDSKSRRIAWIPFFCDFKMALLNLQSPGFLNKKSTLARFSKIQVDRPDQHIRLSPSQGVRFIFMTSIFVGHKKRIKMLGKAVFKISACSLSAVWYAKTKFSWANFSDFCKLPQISRKKCGKYIWGPQLQYKKFPLLLPKVFI